MRRTVVLALLLTLALLAAACGSKAVAPPAPSPVAPSPSGGGGAPSAAEGEALATQHGCLACHSVDGNVSVGPTWKGLFGKEETLAGGQKVRVDEEYLRESMVIPNAKVVEGFLPGIMPQDFGAKLSERQVQSLIEYIRTLK